MTGYFEDGVMKIDTVCFAGFKARIVCVKNESLHYGLTRVPGRSTWEVNSPPDSDTENGGREMESTP